MRYLTKDAPAAREQRFVRCIVSFGTVAMASAPSYEIRRESDDETPYLTAVSVPIMQVAALGANIGPFPSFLSPTNA